MLMTGDLLQNRYSIISLLGQGGMGAVYHAQDARLKAQVALKELMPQPGLPPATLNQLRKQFQQEATVLAHLSHSHLVNVTDYFEEGGRVYLVMDFVEGESLSDLIERGGALPEDRVLMWADQLLDALEYCHSQGVIHRDVKPDNVIIRPDGRVVLVDFGLVKLWDADDPRTRTAVRGLGTPEYAAPEQYGVRPGHTDPRSDVYSLGATMYHALTGQAPMSANDRVADPDHFAPIGVLNSCLSLRTQAVVTKAMELSRKDRFQSAAVMRRALRRREIGSLPPPKRQPAKSRSSFSALLKRMPTWGWVLGSVAFATVLCLGTLSVALPSIPIFTPKPTNTPTLTLTPSPSRVPPTPRPTAFPSMTPIPTETSPPTPEPTATPRPTATPLATGYVLTVDHWEVRVERVQTAKTLEFDGSIEKAAGRFALLFLAVTNRGLSPDTFTAFGDVEIQDADGNRYEEHAVASLYAQFQYNTDWGVDINPDSTAHIVAAFDVSESSEYYLLVPGSLAETYEGRVLLNVP